MLFEKLYGKSHADTETGGLVVVENPELIVAPPQPQPPMNDTTNSKAAPPNNVSPGAASSGSRQGSSGSAPRSAINRQIETRTKDGRRRITPVYIPTNPDQGWVLKKTFPFGMSFKFSLFHFKYFFANITSFKFLGKVKATLKLN